MSKSNLEMYNILRVVPNEAKKTSVAGRLKGFTDINPMWRIKMLTETFGMAGFGWYYDIIEQKKIEGCDGQVSVFVDINLYVKVGDEWSKPISGIGGSSFIAKESRGLYQSDECFKMALTDAIGVACKSLGMGADVYFEKDRTKYDAQSDSSAKGTTASVVDSKVVASGIAEMLACKNIDEVGVCWNKYKQLQSDKGFYDACLEVQKNFKTNK